MRRLSLLTVAALLMCLPMVGEGQSIRSHTPGGGETVLTFATPDTTTTGTAEETLATYNIPAGTFANNGDQVVIFAAYSTAANGNTKQQRINIDGTGTGLIPSTTTSGGWLYAQVTCTRYSATNAVCMIITAEGNPSAEAQYVASLTLTFSAAIPVAFRGLSPTSAGDITLRMYKVVLKRN